MSERHESLRAESCDATSVLWSLAQGNKRYVDRVIKAQQPLLEMLLEDPLKPAQLKAIVISCAHSYAPMASIFDVEPGQIQSVRACGYVCEKGCGVTGSIEFAMAKDPPPVLIVLGNSRNHPVESALHCVLEKSGRSGQPTRRQLMSNYHDDDLQVVRAILPSAIDALLQKPNASFDQLAELTAKLNVWTTIETLLRTSRTISDLVAEGRVQVHGAYLQAESGKVQFLGQHPSQAELLSASERPGRDVVRTAEDPHMPAEEALVMLCSGNRRFALGRPTGSTSADQRLLEQLAEGGQFPVAVALGCADSRAQVETLFDVRPGDLFVLRSAGNSCASASGSLIGSAEYAVANLHTKLLVVSGHTKCGAVTAAVDAVNICGFGDSIGGMPANICHCAEEAVRRCPEGSLEEQVDVATHLNVWATIERLIKDSQIIKKACQSGQVQVHGAVYDIFTGDVKWLGQHHNLEQIVDMPLPLHRWKVSKYTRPCLNNSQELGSPGCCSETGPRKFQTALAKLQAGNRRFTESNWHTLVPETVHEPFAIIIGGAEMRVPIEKIFDADPGDLVVQQVIGSIAGHLGGNLFSSIEYAIVRFQPKLLLVLGGSHSPIIATALQQVHGADLPSPPTRTVVDCVMVSAMRAVDQVREEPAMTLARRDMQIQQLTVDFNVLYTIEQLLKSAVVRDAVTKHGLELHAGVLNETNGEVEFLGQHPMLHEIMAMHAKDSNAATAMGVVGGAQGRRSQLQRNSSQSMASCVSEAYEGQVIPVGAALRPV